MASRRNALILLVAAAFSSLLYVCSGGGSPGKYVHWRAPESFSDNTPLEPSRDLRGFEIYIKQDSPSFLPFEHPVATVSPLETKFNLTDVSPPLAEGVTYYVSIRSISVTGVKSGFSPASSFTLP